MKSLRTFSIRNNKIVFWIGLCVLTVVTIIGGLWIGSVSLSPGDVFSALIGKDTTSTAAKNCVIYKASENLVRLFLPERRYRLPERSFRQY